MAEVALDVDAAAAVDVLGGGEIFAQRDTAAPGAQRVGDLAEVGGEEAVEQLALSELASLTDADPAALDADLADPAQRSAVLDPVDVEQVDKQLQAVLERVDVENGPDGMPFAFELLSLLVVVIGVEELLEPSTEAGGDLLEAPGADGARPAQQRAGDGPGAAREHLGAEDGAPVVVDDDDSERAVPGGRTLVVDVALRGKARTDLIESVLQRVDAAVDDVPPGLFVADPLAAQRVPVLPRQTLLADAIDMPGVADFGRVLPGEQLDGAPEVEHVGTPADLPRALAGPAVGGAHRAHRRRARTLRDMSSSPTHRNRSESTNRPGDRRTEVKHRYREDGCEFGEGHASGRPRHVPLRDLAVVLGAERPADLQRALRLGVVGLQLDVSARARHKPDSALHGSRTSRHAQCAGSGRSSAATIGPWRLP